MNSKAFFGATIVAGTLALSAGLANAATVTDASFGLDGTYDARNGTVAFSGGFSGNLYGDPTVPRDYDLQYGAYAGNESIGGTLPLSDLAGGEFSLEQAYGFLAEDFDFLVDLVTPYVSNVQIDNDSLSGDFAFELGYGEAQVVQSLVCDAFAYGNPMARTGGGSGCDIPWSGGFGLDLALTYDDGMEAPAPIPLPASLPLLAAGIGGMGALRRLRKARG